MQTEILLLVASVILGIVQLFLGSAAETSVRGTAYNMGNREEQVPPLKGAPRRIQLAFENFKETFPFFAAAVLALALTNRFSSLSAIGAELYFWGRVVYLAVYTAGIVGLRSLVWITSMVGIALLLVSFFH